MDYDQLIRNWRTKASDEDYFSKFVFEYLAFIAFLKKKCFKDAISDRSAIQRLKRDPVIKDKYLQQIEGDASVKQAWHNIKNELDTGRLGNVSRNSEEIEEIKWWNCSSDQISQSLNNDIKGIIRDLTDWENMVEFWYSIRNNLFHGGKDPQDARDQLLVENGYITLSALMEIMLLEVNI